MNSLSIQRSLAILEERYHELREIGEKRLQEWEKEKVETYKTVNDLKQEISAKIIEVERERSERAAGAMHRKVPRQWLIIY